MLCARYGRLMVTKKELEQLRAAAMQKALDGDVKGAANLAALHDVVKKDVKDDDQKDDK